MGNLTRLTNALNRSTTYLYDDMDRLVGSTDALGGRTTYGYDRGNHLTTAQDALGRTTTYAYDLGGRLTNVTDALSGVATSGCAGRTPGERERRRERAAGGFLSSWRASCGIPWRVGT